MTVAIKLHHLLKTQMLQITHFCEYKFIIFSFNFSQPLKGALYQSCLYCIYSSIKCEWYNNQIITLLPMLAVANMWVGWSMRFVTLSVRTLKEKQLELSTPKLADIQCMVAAWHALTLRSKGRRSRSRGYQMCCRCGYTCRYDCFHDCYRWFLPSHQLIRTSQLLAVETLSHSWEWHQQAEVLDRQTTLRWRQSQT